MLNKNCSQIQETSPGASKTRFVLTGFSSETEDTARAELDTRLLGRGLPGPLCEKGPFLPWAAGPELLHMDSSAPLSTVSWTAGGWWWCCSPRSLWGEMMEIHASSSPWWSPFLILQGWSGFGMQGWAVWVTPFLCWGWWGSISNWYCEFQLPNRSRWKRLLRYAGFRIYIHLKSSIIIV